MPESSKRSRHPGRPLWIVIALLVLAVIDVLVEFARRTEADRLIYCLDDAYIHLAIAKNLVTHGVFGVTPYGFTFASSSPLWIGILGLASLPFGPAEIIPFVINLLLALVLLVVIARVLEKQAASASVQAIVLLAILFHAPLIPNVFSGMEHVLHMVLSVVFLVVAAETLTNPTGTRSFKILLWSAPALTTVRYEGLFLVGVVALLSTLRGERKRALWLTVAGAAPVTLLGLWSMLQGSYFLPNSVLLKGSRPVAGSLADVPALVGHGFGQLAANRWIGRLVAISLGVWLARLKRVGPWRAGQVQLLIFICAAYLHAQFASWGWYYRYEAYLIVMGVTALGSASVGWYGTVRRLNRPAQVLVYLSMLGALIFLGDGLLGRCFDAIERTPKAMKNIYEQQYQMGRFLDRYYSGAGVYAHDIGAIDFLADLRTVDLVGLANTDVLRATLRGQLDQEARKLISRDDLGQIGVIYEQRFGRFFSELDWIEVARWTIADNIVCDQPTVLWVARDVDAARVLAAHLIEFAPELPSDVVQSLLSSRPRLGSSEARPRSSVAMKRAPG